MSTHFTLSLPFEARESLPGTHELAQFLFRLMREKRTNLCLSADVSSTAEVLQLAEAVGDSICMIKTHADIIDDFGPETTRGLREIAVRKKFVIFEDRKFGDIGSTVQKQYSAGPLRILDWAHLTNAHVFPGPKIIDALKASATLFRDGFVRQNIAQNQDEGASSKTLSATTLVESKPTTEQRLSEGRALLLLAQMSSEGNLLSEDYTMTCVDMARKHRDFVIGFIAQRSLNSQPGDNFITFTPGVSLPERREDDNSKLRGDDLGQQYNTPYRVIFESGCDVVIVGRGILRATDRAAEAERYRKDAWAAYEKRTKINN